MGGEDYTVFGLSGVGDTFGTCFGPLSRNRMVRTRLPLPLPLPLSLLRALALTRHLRTATS